MFLSPDCIKAAYRLVQALLYHLPAKMKQALFRPCQQGFSPTAIHDAFTKLCGLPNVALPIPHRMMTALQWYSDGMDFADALHLAASQGCRTFYTFDQKLVSKADRRSQCKGKEP